MICSRLRSLWKAKGEVTLGQRELLGTGSRLLSSLSPQSGSGTGAFPPHPRPKAREEGMDLEAGVGGQWLEGVEEEEVLGKLLTETIHPGQAS